MFLFVSYHVCVCEKCCVCVCGGVSGWGECVLVTVCVCVCVCEGEGKRGVGGWGGVRGGGSLRVRGTGM